jgi:cytochrome c553
MLRRAVVSVVLSTVAAAQSVQDGKDVYGPCAGCHGANGEGGKGGEYPRIAGQPPEFTLFSLKQFQERKRKNLPMFPYTEPRELSERDMKDVAAYLARISLPTKVPEFKDTDSALDRLLMMERVLVVPRVEGDVRKGKVTYRKACAKCHGTTAKGRDGKRAPLLVGQYPDYLRRQFDAFKKGERGAEADDPMKGVLDQFSEQELTDVLAWLTSIQEDAEEREPEQSEP